MKKLYFGLAIAFVAIIAVTGATFVYNVSAPPIETLSENKNLKAAIIDQLYTDIPNENFHKQARDYLEGAGYEVDIIKTEDVTIDFYKKLPSFDYDIIVVRTHGAADRSNDDMVTLFTGEKYQEDKYISDQLFGIVKRATPLYTVTFDTTNNDAEWQIVNDTYRTLTSPVRTETSSDNEFFVITPKLIHDATIGNFEGTIFILGGCNTMTSTSMAESLVRKGASSVVGWDDEVTSMQNDLAILALLEQLLISKSSTTEAITSVMEKFVTQDYSKPILKHYP